MARNSATSQEIYKRHIRLYRTLNDAYIFLQLIKPDIAAKVEQLRTSNNNKKRIYQVPKKGKLVVARRTDADVSGMLRGQYDRGVYESLIISLVSRFETYIQECVQTAIRNFPKKLPLLGDTKSGVPVEMFVRNADFESTLEEYVRLKCNDLMFNSPKEYLEKFQQILSIEIAPATIASYMEIKASRDLIVHTDGGINAMYRTKAGTLARGELGDELPIDANYFDEVFVTLKQFSGAILAAVEAKYK